MKKEHVLIAAAAQDGDGNYRVLGLEGDMPWDIPQDLKRFKRLTTGHPLIYGRGTFDSFKRRPLPRRLNIVLSKSLPPETPGVTVAKSIDSALEAASRAIGEDENLEYPIFFGGGEIVYRQTMHLANRLEITEIHEHYRGDTFLPEIELNVWGETNRENHDGFSFVTYEKK